ncbi:hypothetical protein DLM_2851 [Aquitalea magnusonii]|jgi:hypothetical protein|uniref:DUF4936 domain-containing protein n=1 Tax=Aquitalea magnusonii TaxID=332411 RepID=A0A3G9GK57_9NEIS|nr:DUF4936 family protein [Aquitalea magnusonii]BBF86452.1 hypothetical protein DLM_2851 [Aquitalea magnusonii]
MISDFALLQSLQTIEESQPMSCELYVYYKICPEQAPLLLPRLRQMQAGLSAHGVQASLLCRQDEAQQDGLHTWMEVYRQVSDARMFTRQLQQALCDCGLDQVLTARHAEWFVPVAGEERQSRRRE